MASTLPVVEELMQGKREAHKPFTPFFSSSLNGVFISETLNPSCQNIKGSVGAGNPAQGGGGKLNDQEVLQ